MQEEHFFYLFGAGASAGSISTYGPFSNLTDILDSSRKHEEKIQVIPTVLELRKRIKLLSNFLNEYKGHLNKKESPLFPVDQFDSELIRIISKLNWLYGKLDHFPNVDELAENLSKNSDQGFLELKAILSIYFILEQVFHGVDSRYKTFITSIIASTKERENLPNCISIFTWNYDYQLEESIIESRNRFNSNLIVELIENRTIKYPDDLDNKKLSDIEFPIVKLNGCTASYQSKVLNKAKVERTKHFSFVSDLVCNCNPLNFPDLRYNSNYLYDRLSNILPRIFNIYQKSTFPINEFIPSIGFSWDEKREKLISWLNSNSKIDYYTNLVCIGYSFPILNFQIDKEILRSPHLKNIYVQCLPNQFDEISSRIRDLLENYDVNIRHINGINNFYIPGSLLNYLRNY